jgi:CRISPR/Cas system-associated endonuclease Cas1
MRLETEVAHPDAGGQTAYRRVLELQARRLARALTEKQADYVPFEMPR